MKVNRFLSLLALTPIVAVLTACPKNDADAISDANQRRFSAQEEKVKLRDVIHYGEGAGNPAPSVGNTRVLVVPIEFTDYPADDIGKYYNAELDSSSVAKKHTDDAAPSGRGADNALEDIRKLYFGEPEETTWHSLSSYYKSTSYGKLNFNGVVVPWWTKAYVETDDYTPVSTGEFLDADKEAKWLLRSIVNDIAKYDYDKFNDEEGHPFTSEAKFRQYFDSDKDGFIDLVEAVYSAPFRCKNTSTKHTQSESDDVFWAYCGSSFETENLNKPKFSKWAWQSYYTAVEGGVRENGEWRLWSCTEIANGTAKVDGHTVIHETGHGLGLADYYNYDGNQDGKTSGAVDMMAYNVGDHNSHSKSLLGWVDPVVVTGPTRVTINSFNKTGDCIYLPYRGYFEDGTDTDKKFKNTFSTEYIAIELMTPTGVNQADSDYPYMDHYPQVPTIGGIKAYHVDSRIAVLDKSTGAFYNYTSSIVSVDSSKYVDYAHCNTPSRTVKNADGSYNFQLEYLYRNKNAGVITNESLYKQGDVLFSGEFHPNFVMNSGAKLGYKVTIESLSYDPANPEAASATLLFEANHY